MNPPDNTAVNGGNTGGKKKVAIVEDDKFLAGLIVKKIRSAGYDVFLWNDGDSALPGIEQEKPDVLILDLLLEGMSGYDILKSIRNNPALKTMPVIILSNLGSKKDIEQAQVLGINAFLVKATINLDEIIGHIDRILKTV